MGDIFGREIAGGGGGGGTPDGSSGMAGTGLTGTAFGSTLLSLLTEIGVEGEDDDVKLLSDPTDDITAEATDPGVEGADMSLVSWSFTG
jgi:hypothetical protein